MQNNELTDKQIEALRHIRNYLVHHGQAPSIRDLMEEMQYKSPRSVQDILEVLVEFGYIRRNKQGSIQLERKALSDSGATRTVDVPLVGTAACGLPIYAEENIEAYIPVSTSIAKTGHRYFFLRAQGDSMDKAGIDDGALVLVRQQNTADNGDSVVALIDDEATIKQYQRNSEAVVLKPQSNNPDHQPIILNEDFQIQGVVIKSISDI